MSTFKIRDVDKGWKKHGRMITRAARSNPHVMVGIQGPKGETTHPDSTEGITVVEIGTAHEFGAGVPERSHHRANFDEKTTKYIRDMKTLGHKISAGKISVKTALSVMGLRVENDLKMFMRKGIPPNKVDGEPARLIDNAHYIGSISSEVRGI
jgi:hypothetical protein